MRSLIIAFLLTSICFCFAGPNYHEIVPLVNIQLTMDETQALHDMLRRGGMSGVIVEDGWITQWFAPLPLPTQEDLDTWKAQWIVNTANEARLAALKEIAEGRKRLTELQDLKSIDPTAVATADLITIEAEVDAALDLYKATYPVTVTDNVTP